MTFIGKTHFFMWNKNSLSFILSLVENANLVGEKVKPGH